MTTYHRITDATTIPASVVKAISKVTLDMSLRHRHISVATLKGRVTAVGVNTSTKTHPLMKQYADKAKFPHKQYLHSEIDALLKAKGKVDTLYVIRIGVRGDWKYSLPCPCCQIGIDLAGINCYYS